MTEEESRIREYFEGLSQDEFDEWLQAGLAQFYAVENPSTQGFTLVSPFLGLSQVEPSLVDDLARLYDNMMRPPARMKFRAAVFEVLRAFFHDPTFPAEAIVDLVYLLPRIQAREVLEILPQLVADGRSGRENGWLLRECMGIVKSMQPAKAARDALEAFATSPVFEPEYTFDILTELCLSSRSDWLQQVLLMNGNLIKLFDMAEKADRLDEFDAEQALFVETLTSYIQLPLLKQALNDDSLDWMKYEACRGASGIIRALLDKTTGPFVVSKTLYKSDKGDEMLKIDLMIKDKPSPHVSIHTRLSSSFYIAMGYSYEPSNAQLAAISKFMENHQTGQEFHNQLKELWLMGTGNA